MDYLKDLSSIWPLIIACAGLAILFHRVNVVEKELAEEIRRNNDWRENRFLHTVNELQVQIRLLQKDVSWIRGKMNGREIE